MFARVADDHAIGRVEVGVAALIVFPAFSILLRLFDPRQTCMVMLSVHVEPASQPVLSTVLVYGLLPRGL